MVPIGRVMAIYARENGPGLAVPAPAPAVLHSDAGGATGGLAVVEDQAPSTADDAKGFSGFLPTPPNRPTQTTPIRPVPALQAEASVLRLNV